MCSGLRRTARPPTQSTTESIRPPPTVARCICDTICLGGIKGKILDNIPPRDAAALSLGFHQLWERSGRTITDVIVRYTPTYRARRDPLLCQSLTCLATLVIGVMTGIVFALQSQPTLSALVIVGWLVATLGTGLLGTILSNELISNRFG